jgi:DNA-binding FadR family transcriptional regulator
MTQHDATVPAMPDLPVVRDSMSSSWRRSDQHLEAPRKASVWVARDLASYISDRKLAEGTRLPPEHEMQAIFGVGRTTLREALRVLEMRGIIVIRPGRGGGPVVRKPRTTDLAESLGLILQFQGATLADIIQARLLLEPSIACAAAAVMNQATVAQLRETVDIMLIDATDEVRFAQENNRFHAIIAGSVGNPVVSVLLDSLKFVHDGRAAGVQYRPRGVKAVAAAHAQIIDAIEASDPERAEEAMREHLQSAKKYWSKNFPQSYVKPLRWLTGD